MVVRATSVICNEKEQDRPYQGLRKGGKFVMFWEADGG